MTGDDNLETTLTRLGADDGPPADPAFANRLDAALRAAHSEQVRDRHRRSVRIPVTAGVSALAAMVVGALIWLVAFAGDPAAEVVMTAAVDTQVVLPGEAARAGEAGVSLPDGTRIVVGPDGEAIVDGVVLGPGAEAIVNNGSLNVLGPARAAPTDRGADGPEASDPNSGTTVGPLSSTTTAQGSDDGSDGASPSSTRPSTSTSSRSSTVADRSTTSTPTTATTRPPRPTDGSGATTAQTSSTRPPTTTGTTSTTTLTTDPAPLSIELTATSVPRSRVRLDWVVEGGPSPDGFRVEATTGDRTSTIVLIRSSGARSATIERLAQGVSYRVVAVTDDGTTLQTSNSVAQPSP